MPHILIVEDDRSLHAGIALALGEAVFACAYTLEEAEAALTASSIDLVILDINLPDGSGLDLLRRLRRHSEVPVLLLTANDLERDEVAGLEAGADDYVTKPFSLAVLRARAGRLLSRRPAGGISLPPFAFDFAALRFTVDGAPVDLSRTEQRLLRLLVENRGRTLSRDLLLSRVWDGGEFVDENALSVAVRRLRSKLPGAPIKTVYGVGYQWEAAK